MKPAPLPGPGPGPAGAAAAGAAAGAGAVYAAALDSCSALHAREHDGERRSLAITSWLADADDVDERVLDRARGPVLDVGCGPGRHVRALQRRGVEVLGLDASPAAAALARSRGAAAVVEGSIFGVVPGDGAWSTALLLDGNLGIGGDPVRLLIRVAQLLAGDGTILVESDPPGIGVAVGPVRLEGAQLVSAWFAWARVGADALDGVAALAGLRVAARWDDASRWFATLVRA